VEVIVTNLPMPTVPENTNQSAKEQPVVAPVNEPVVAHVNEPVVAHVNEPVVAHVNEPVVAPADEIFVSNVPMHIPTVTDVLTENLTYAKDVIVDSAVALKETLLPGIKLVRDDSPVLKAPVQTPSMKAREMHERILAENL